MANTHLEHLEDDILNQGSKGGHNAIAFLRSLGDMLGKPQSNMKVTTKWDGAPAVICGIHPGTGNFFVGTKGVFAKMPKICVTHEDVDTWYSGALAEKLKTCLDELPKLGIKGVLQGDLLFTNDTIIKNINGEKSLVFQPNTITYAVPANTDMAKRLQAAKVGIVFHTSYSGGPTLRDMKASFGVNVRGMQGVKSVAVFSSNFSDDKGKSYFTNAERIRYNAAVKKAEGSLKQASKFLDILQKTGDGKFMLSPMFKIYFNTYIRQGKTFPSAASVSKGFTDFYSAALDKEISLKKQETTKKKYLKMKEDGLKFIKANNTAIYMTVASYMNLTAAKTMVIRQLEKVQGIGTYIKTENGYKVTAPEGFVAIKSGSALKLVDRLEFSRANFTVEKNWG